MYLTLNYKLRNKMLYEPIIGFTDEEIDRKKTKSLIALFDYYDDVLEAIGGPEIHQLLELRAKVEHVLAERLQKKREQREKIYEKNLTSK